MGQLGCVGIGGLDIAGRRRDLASGGQIWPSNHIRSCGQICGSAALSGHSCPAVGFYQICRTLLAAAASNFFSFLFVARPDLTAAGQVRSPLDHTVATHSRSVAAGVIGGGLGCTQLPLIYIYIHIWCLNLFINVKFIGRFSTRQDCASESTVKYQVVYRIQVYTHTHTHTHFFAA